MTNTREPKINTHVARLNRFLPFSPAHDQIFEEYQTGEDSLDLKTQAIDYAKKAIRAGVRLIVLTGDAGHGKTHMCRRLMVEHLGLDAKSARLRLLDSCNGSCPIEAAAGFTARTLRIHKDLSEIQPPAKAAQLLEQVAAYPDETLVVCANEGRLRAIVSSAASGKVCRSISEVFQSSFKSGMTASVDGQIHIINLNFQSVAANGAGTSESLIRRTLRDWVGDKRRWNERGCGACSLEELCPIRRNRGLLADEDEASKTRLRRLEELFEVIERLGHVVTIREMLMLVAYVITGGLTCKDVHDKAARSQTETGWQYAWSFYNLLFQPSPTAPEDRIYKGIPILNALRRIDPGSIASRKVDERILHQGDIFEPGQLDLQFVIQKGGGQVLVDAADGIDDFIGNPQSKAELQREAEMTRTAVAALRRRAFFDDAGAEGTVMARLGFRYGDAFLRMLDGTLTRPEMVRLKNTFISGLHALQGLRMNRSETALNLVDPAFGKASADAAIIAGHIPGSHLSLIPAKDVWGNGRDEWTLPVSVDWIDRTVALRVDERLGVLHHLHLDLLAFECIARAASGYVSEDFYANEIRRVRTFLGRLAERGRTDNGQISVFMNGRLQHVSIDMGVIMVGGR